MSKTEEVLNLIKGFIKYVEKLTDEEIEMISLKQAAIKFNYVNFGDEKTLKPQKVSIKKVATQPFDTQHIIESLKVLTNREEGVTFLNKNCTKRGQLDEIAKQLDVPNFKKYNMEQLKIKIIEATIGYRLTSQAVQNNNGL